MSQIEAFRHRLHHRPWMRVNASNCKKSCAKRRLWLPPWNMTRCCLRLWPSETKRHFECLFVQFIWKNTTTTFHELHGLIFFILCWLSGDASNRVVNSQISSQHRLSRFHFVACFEHWLPVSSNVNFWCSHNILLCLSHVSANPSSSSLNSSSSSSAAAAALSWTDLFAAREQAASASVKVQQLEEQARAMQDQCYKSSQQLKEMVWSLCLSRCLYFTR